MAALTIERKTPKLGQDVLPNFPTNLGIGLAANAKCLAGGMVAQNSSGYAVAASAVAGQPTLGVSEKTVDNTGGANGALTIAPRSGVFQMNNSAGADAIASTNVGQVCYVADDNTVALTSSGGTRPIAGLIVAVDSGTPGQSQPTGVWVLIGATLGLTAPASLAEMQVPADAAAGTVTAETVFGYAKLPTTASGILYIPSAAVTASDTLYATITVGWRSAAGGALQTIGSQTTKITGGSGNLTAWVALSNFGTLTNQAIPQGASFTYSIAKASTGTQLPAAKLILL